MNPLLAVHIADGLLAAPWWLGGFALMGALAIRGGWRLRDEEIPRVAVFTSAFFVASLIHVRMGPTSAHLLLNGLVGVVLGWRAALAIPIAVFLQAIIFFHGGFTTIGINSCVMLLPALIASCLFRLLQGTHLSCPFWRGGLVAVTCLCLMGSAILSYSLISVSVADAPAVSGVEVLTAAPAQAGAIAVQPVMLATTALLTALAIWLERRLEHTPEFPLGLLIGGVTVLATVALNCVVLIAGGETNWSVPASLLVLAHLPLAIVEGVVLGFTVGLLARARPDILGIKDRPARRLPPRNTSLHQSHPVCSGSSVVMALALVLMSAAPAWAHRLKGEYKVLPGQSVRVEAWYDITGDSPAGAVVRVLRETGEPLTEGKLNEKGTFTFSYVQPEPLRVIISAGAGHQETLRIERRELSQQMNSSAAAALPGSEEVPSADRRNSFIKLLLRSLLGIGAVSALAVFASAWLHRFRQSAY